MRGGSRIDEVFFFFKQKTAYEIKECDWSSDVCSSDLGDGMVVIGEKVSDVGDLIDEMISGGKKVKKSYDELKEVIETEEAE